MKLDYRKILLFISFCISGSLFAQDIPVAEKNALQAIYTAANGDNWTNTTQRQGQWDFSTPVTSWNATTQTGWYGVTVTSGHVTDLKLSANNLDGTLSAGIGDLTYLKEINFENNKLAGAIPSSFGQLVNLVNLAISGNKFNSFPPEFANLKKLQTLFMYSNPFNSAFPTVVFELPALKRFIGNFCGFTGVLPNSFHKIPDLTQFSAQYNQLSGTLPSSLSTLTKLTGLDIPGNQFEGRIPSLVNINTLVTLNITRNKFRFSDFANEFTTYKSNITGFSYSPQEKTDAAKTIARNTNQTVYMEMFTDLNYHSGDTYQWFKNNVAISGATSRHFAISSLTTAAAGTYTCKAYHTTNPDMSPLILERQPITLTVSSTVVNCDPTQYPVTFNQTSDTGQPYVCGTLKITPQIANSSNIAEIRWVLRKTSTSEVITTSTQISPVITITNPGVYTLSGQFTDLNGCEYGPAIGVEMIDCATCQAPIPGEIVLSNTNYTCGGRGETLSFTNTNNVDLKYEWKFYGPDGVSLDWPHTIANPNFYFTNYGVNRVDLVVKHRYYDCNTRTLSMNIPVVECKNSCPIIGELTMTDCNDVEKSASSCEYTCGDRLVYLSVFAEEQIYENSTYSWVFKDPSGQVIGTSTSSNYRVPFTFTTVGNNKVELTITNADGCPTVFTPLTVPVVACTNCPPVVGQIKVVKGIMGKSQKK